jgi:hypothetical protein
MKLTLEKNKNCTIEDFAEQYSLKTRRDECNDIIIPGKFGHIYDNEGRGLLGVVYMPDPHGKYDFNPIRWGNRRRNLLAAGCQIKNDGDGEGIALFDPANLVQARLAIQVAGIKRKRPASQADRLHVYRFSKPHAIDGLPGT